VDLAVALGAVVSVGVQRSEQAVLERTVELGRVLCGARYGVALLLGPDGAACALAHQGMTAGQVAQLPHLPRPVGLVAVVLSGQPVRLERIADHRSSVGFPAGHAPMAALLGVPVVFDGQVLGGLYLTRPPGEEAFSDSDELIATALAGQAAAAVDALRRCCSAQTVVAALGMTDVRAGEQPAAGEDPAASPVVQRLLSAARRTLGVELTFLSRLEQGQQTFIHLDAAGQGPPLTAGTTVPVSEGYCQLMIDGRIPASVPDVAAHPVLGAMGVTAALGVGAYCGVPVRLPDGSLYGTLCGLDSSAGAAPSPSQLQSLHLIAGLLGEAVQQQQQAEQARHARAAAFAPMLSGGQRTLVLQPIVDLRRQIPVGYEALSRFTDPGGALRRPDQVFGEAAQLGLGVQLEQAAARDALAVLPELPPGTYLSVNLSPASLLDPGTYDLLAASRLDRIVVELTEHEQISDYPALLRALAGLRERGLRLAVDDAGSGFASLQHITQLNPDIIKLDIAFVRAVDVDPSRRAVTRALLAFATELGATLVAEGIETAGELDQLLALGTHLGQGYHLGRPGPAGQVLADHRPPASRSWTT
jgi:EAL domain-containing protein (putative c-di-GMP-specific phosphodiesterase class I)